LKTKIRQLTPSAPLLSLAVADDEGALSLTIFGLGFWLGVDMLLFNLQYMSDRGLLFVSWLHCLRLGWRFLIREVSIDVHCSPSHGQSVGMNKMTIQHTISPSKKKSHTISSRAEKGEKQR
jgi:hypothetical protein